MRYFFVIIVVYLGSSLNVCKGQKSNFNELYKRHAFISQKHNIAIGLDYKINGYSPEWVGNNSIRVTNYDPDSKFLSKTAHWLTYSYQNKMAVRFYAAMIEQFAGYNPSKKMPDDFLIGRLANVADITFGYNFLKKDSRLASWLFAGIGEANDVRIDRITIVPGWIDAFGSGEHAQRKFCPVVQLMVKYNVSKVLFADIGGTYQYIFDDFQAVSLNLGIGFQFGMFNGKTKNRDTHIHRMSLWDV